MFIGSNSVPEAETFKKTVAAAFDRRSHRIGDQTSPPQKN
jgi:hypothetical protein